MPSESDSPAPIGPERPSDADRPPEPAAAPTDPDLVDASVLRSRRDAPWAILADAALVVFAIELALRFRVSWGLAVLAGTVLVVATQLARYRYRVVALAAQVKLAAGLVLMAACVALLVRPDDGPALYASISALGAAGVAKLVRELARYRSLKRRMLEIGRRRRRNLKAAAVSGGVFLVTAVLACSGFQQTTTDVRLALVVWLAGYSLVSVAMELWA